MVGLASSSVHPRSRVLHRQFHCTVVVPAGLQLAGEMSHEELHKRRDQSESVPRVQPHRSMEGTKSREECSCVSAPAKYIARPRPSSIVETLIVREFIHHFPRPSYQPDFSPFRDANPVVSTDQVEADPRHPIPPAVFPQDKGTPADEHSTKKAMRAARYSCPLASRWKSSATS